jgi:hypothetical protein
MSSKLSAAEEAGVVCLIALGMLLTGSGLGHYFARTAIQIEAVERGKAEWAVQPNGSTVFTWKEDKSE